MPQGKHSALQSDLIALINSPLRTDQIARVFQELRCTFGGSSVVPDIAVFEWSRIQRDPNGEIANGFPLAPDWTIEILSPGQSIAKVTKKILCCLHYGSQMGWLIASADKVVLIYQPQQEPSVLDAPNAVLPVSDFAQNLAITVENLFALLLL